MTSYWTRVSRCLREQICPPDGNLVDASVSLRCLPPAHMRTVWIFSPDHSRYPRIFSVHFVGRWGQRWHDGFEVSDRLRALSPTPTQHVQPVVPAPWTQNTQVIDHMALLSFSHMGFPSPNCSSQWPRRSHQGHVADLRLVEQVPMRCLKPQAHHRHAQRTALAPQCAIPDYIVAALCAVTNLA